MNIKDKEHWGFIENNNGKNMKKLDILFDLDDVLWDLITPWVEAINYTYGTNVKPEEITEWDIAKFFPKLVKEQIFSPIYNDEFWMTVIPTDGGVYYLRKLLDDGHQIKIVTASCYKTIRPKMERLFTCYPFLSWDDVIVTMDKHCIKGDALVDDNPDNLMGGDYYKILNHKPHNQLFNADKYGIPRVYGLKEAYEKICSFARITTKVI